MKNNIKNKDLDNIFEKYIQTGRSEYFTELVNTLQNWIKGIVANYVKDDDEQEDILQETWIRVELNKNDFDSSKSSVKSWIYSRYLKGLILHYLRDNKKKIDRTSSNKIIINDEDEIDFLESLPADIADPEKNLIRLERAFILKKGLKSLEEKLQDVILLHHFGGRQLDEISAMMRVEYATIRTWHHRAMQKLQSFIIKRLR